MNVQANQTALWGDPRRFKYSQFHQETDFSLKCTKLLHMRSLNNDIYHLMQSFLVKTELTRTPTYAEHFCRVYMNRSYFSMVRYMIGIVSKHGRTHPYQNYLQVNPEGLKPELDLSYLSSNFIESGLSMSCELRVASCELQVASCELQVASCKLIFLRVENCELMHFASCILRVENI